MHTKYDFRDLDTDKIVYIRPVDVADLPKDVREQALGAEVIYALHNAQGERLALVANRRMAVALAEEHDMTPVAVH